MGGRSDDFIKRWQAEGWQVSRTNGGHLKFTHAEVAQPVFHGSTPSDIRAAKNHDARLRRMLRDARDSEIVQARNAATPEGVTVVRQPLKPSRFTPPGDQRELPPIKRPMSNQPPQFVSPEDIYDDGGFYEEPVRYVDQPEPVSEPPAEAKTTPETERPVVAEVAEQPVAEAVRPHPEPPAEPPAPEQPSVEAAPEPAPLDAEAPVAVYAPEEELVPVKRKRGRPPKAKVALAEDAPKRKRGRPPKAKVIPSVVVPAKVAETAWVAPVPARSAPTMAMPRLRGIGLFHERRAAERRAKRRGML